MRRRGKLLRLSALGLTLLIYAPAARVVRAAGEDGVRVRLLGGRLVVVPVRVNGAGPFDFLLDTGTNSTLLSEELAARLGLRPADRVLLGTVAGEVAVPRARLRSVEVGGRESADVEALVCGLRELRALDPRVSGVLGQNVLSRFDYTLSYDRRRIEIAREGDAGPGGVRVPFESDEGRLIVTARPGAGRGLRLVLDAAAGELLLFGEALKAFKPRTASDAPPLYAVTETGRTRADVARIGSLVVGAETLRDVTVGLLRAAPHGRGADGLLPTRLFRAVYFNHRAGYVIFNPQPMR